MWVQVVGPLLSDCAGLSLGDLLRIPLPQLSAHLREPLPFITATTAVAAPQQQDPRTTEDPGLYSVLYRAQCVLERPRGPNRTGASRRLLLDNGHGTVERGAETFIWALMYDPRRVATWQQLASFYEAAACEVQGEAAVTMTAAVWLCRVCVCRGCVIPV